MSSSSVNHNQVANNIFSAFRNYLKEKPCEAFSDGVDVYVTEKDRLIPDIMIVCNKDIIKPDGIHGAPDLIVEVLSQARQKMTRGIKRNCMKKRA